MKIKSVKFDGHSEAYQISRVDFKLDNGKELALFLTEEGKISLCASNPNEHGEFIDNKGIVVKVEHFGYPSD